MTKPEALSLMVNAALIARPQLIHGEWRMNALDFDRICASIDAYRNATEDVDPRTKPALDLLRSLDQRGGLGQDVHEQIRAIIGKEVGLGVR